MILKDIFHLESLSLYIALGVSFLIFSAQISSGDSKTVQKSLLLKNKILNVLILSKKYFLKPTLLILGLIILFHGFGVIYEKHILPPTKKISTEATKANTLPQTAPYITNNTSINSTSTPETNSDTSINSEVILAVIALAITIMMTGILFMSKNAIDSLKEEKDKIKQDYIDKFASLDSNDVKGDLTDYRFSISHQNEQAIQTILKNIELGNNLTATQEKLYEFRLSVSELYTYSSEEAIRQYLQYLRSFDNTEGIRLMDIEHEYINKLRKYYTNYYKKEDQSEIVKLIDDVRKKWRSY